MPLAGIWAAKGDISFVMAMILTVSAGLLGSLILYFLGKFGGEMFINWYLKHFPKQEKLIRKNLDMLRTIISIPAGIVGMNFWSYTVSSTLGIFLWNLALVGAGYAMGDSALRLFG